ncbi:MAG: hypothetical protein WCT10_02170 [Patescibacteria group bacterium]
MFPIGIAVTSPTHCAKAKPGCKRNKEKIAAVKPANRPTEC